MMCEGCEADTFALRLSLFNVFAEGVLRDVRDKMQAPSQHTFQFSFDVFISFCIFICSCEIIIHQLDEKKIIPEHIQKHVIKISKCERTHTIHKETNRDDNIFGFYFAQTNL